MLSYAREFIENVDGILDEFGDLWPLRGLFAHGMGPIMTYWRRRMMLQIFACKNMCSIFKMY